MEIILGFLCFVTFFLGIIIGINLPIIVEKYLLIPSKKEEKKEDMENTTNNLTDQIIREWQYGGSENE